MVQGRRDPEYIKDPDISQYLNAMGKRLAVHAPGGAPEIEVFGVRDPVINAFAMPGGYIGMHTGLIVSSGAEAELAGVLGHEVGHVAAQHSKKRQSAATPSWRTDARRVASLPNHALASPPGSSPSSV